MNDGFASGSPPQEMSDRILGIQWEPRNLDKEKYARTVVYIDPGGHRSVWIIEGNTAKSSFGLIGERIIEALPGEDIFSAIRRFYPWDDKCFHTQLIPIGRFHPRIARPSITDDLSRPIWSCQATFENDATFITEQKMQIELLIRRIESICNVVYPRPENLSAYGHEIRNFILLACTEVEAMWAGVFRCNGVKKDRLTTNDYIKLSEIMRLRAYEVSFPNYPTAPVFSPFKGWSMAAQPTVGIPWYAAYNAIKHRRETDFNKATLHNAFSALSACIIMMIAQFGLRAFGKENELSTKFSIAKAPTWGKEDFYLPYFGSRPAWIALNHSF